MEKSGDAEPHQAPILSPRVLPAPPPYGYAASYHVPAAGATNPSVHPFWSISLDNLWRSWFWYLYVFTNCSQGLEEIIGRIGDAPGMPWQRNKSLLLQFNYAS